MRIKLTEEVDAKDFWMHIMGAGWETWTWWKAVSYVSNANWDTPGIVQLTIWDPDTESNEVTKTLNLDDLVKAYEDFNNDRGSRIHYTDMDAMWSDAVLQIAVLGEIVYG